MSASTVGAEAEEVRAAQPEAERLARRLRRLAVALAAAAVGEALGMLLIAARGDPRFVLNADLITFGFIATVLLFPMMGVLIIQRRPFTRVAWLMIAIGLAVGFGLVAYAYGVVGQHPGAAWPFTIPALIVSRLFFVPAIGTATAWILLLYPTDHLLSNRWRPVGWVAIAAMLAFDAGTLFTPGPFDSTALPGVVNPLGAPGILGGWFAAIAEVANYVGLVALALAAASLVVRYRRADRIVAAQIRWLALVAVLAVAALAISLLPILSNPWDDLAFGTGLTLAACMPIAIGIAITRYHLYDIDRLINRALVYGALTAILAGVFTAAVGLGQRVFILTTGNTSDAAIVGTTLVVATLYAPLRKRLEAVVDRRFKFEHSRFGAYRDELTRLLSATDAQRAAARLVHEAVRDLPALGGATLGTSGAVTATAGIWPVEPVVRISIPGGGGPMRVLAIGPRPDGELHDPRVLAALEEIAGLAADAARARGTDPARR